MFDWMGSKKGTTVLILALGVSMSPLEAGGLSRALSKALYGRLVTKETAIQAEKIAYERILRDLDKKSLQALERRFGSEIPHDALVAARRSPSTFQDKSSYEIWLKRAYPDVSRQQLRGVVGDTHPLTNGVTVNRNQVTLVRTLTHERVHQLSHPGFRASFGRAFDEGVTDYLASRVSKDLHIASVAVGYPAERDIASMVAAVAGEKTLAKAYFKGEFEDLARALEVELGPGGFGKFRNLVRRGDLDATRQLLLGRRPNR